MPSFTTVIENTSPVLRYLPAEDSWRPGTSQDDPFADQYTESSFTVTTLNASFMTFTFNGTGVGLFGAKRQNHGLFSVKVDEMPEILGNGTSIIELFNQTLFSTNSLTRGTHTLLLTNQAPTYLDVDYLTVQTQIGNDDEQLVVNTFQDTHASFLYSPLSAWKTPESVSQFSGSSGHATLNSSAMMTFTFDVYEPIGDGISIYGPVGPQQADSYTVQIDNGSAQLFSATSAFYRSRQILFYATGFGRGSHTLVMQPSSSSGGELAIDYAEVYTVPSLGGISNQPTILSELSEVQRFIPKEVVAALAFTSTVALAVFIVLAYRIWRRIRKEYQSPRAEPVEPFRISAALDSIHSLQLTHSVRKNLASIQTPCPQSMEASPPAYRTIFNGSFGK